MSMEILVKSDVTSNETNFSSSLILISLSLVFRPIRNFYITIFYITIDYRNYFYYDVMLSCDKLTKLVYVYS